MRRAQAGPTVPEGWGRTRLWHGVLITMSSELMSSGNALPCLPLPSLWVPSAPAFSALGQEFRSFCQWRQQLSRNCTTLTSASLNFSPRSTGWPWIAPHSYPCDSDGTRQVPHTGTSEIFREVRALLHQVLQLGFDPWSTHRRRREPTPSGLYMHAAALKCTDTINQ